MSKHSANHTTLGGQVSIGESVPNDPRKPVEGMVPFLCVMPSGPVIPIVPAMWGNSSSHGLPDLSNFGQNSP
jgi:hypothetical protein